MARTLAKILRGSPHVSEVETFASGELFLGALRQLGPRQQAPAAAVIDMRLPGISGAEVVRRLLEIQPDCRPFILSQHPEREMVQSALLAGAEGYLLKDGRSEPILAAMENLAGGVPWHPVDPRVGRFVLSCLPRDRPPVPPGVHELTSREREVLVLLCHGLQAKEIADRLGVTRFAVDRHLRGVYAKLEVGNQAGAVGAAYRYGIVET